MLGSAGTVVGAVALGSNPIGWTVGIIGAVGYAFSADQAIAGVDTMRTNKIQRTVYHKVLVDIFKQSDEDASSIEFKTGLALAVLELGANFTTAVQLANRATVGEAKLLLESGEASVQMVDGAAAVVSKEGQVILRSGGDKLCTAPRVYGPQPPPGVKEPPSSAFTRPSPYIFNPDDVDDFLDSAISAIPEANRLFLIGETQARIRFAAPKLGHKQALEFWPENMMVEEFIPELHQAWSIEFNKHLVRKLHENGFKFFDMGPDANRLLSGNSAWYQAELDVLKELNVSPTKITPKFPIPKFKPPGQ